MQLTLRKAHKLRKEIEAALASRTPVVSVALNALDLSHVKAPQDYIQAAIDDLLLAGNRDFQTLSSVLTSIRIAIGKANASSSAQVDVKLAQAADIDRRSKFWNKIATATVMENSSVTSERLARARRSDETPSERGFRMGGGSETTLSVSIVSSEMRKEASEKVMALKREREALDDSRLEANARETIEIADEDVAFLREQRIL